MTSERVRIVLQYYDQTIRYWIRSAERRSVERPEGSLDRYSHVLSMIPKALALLDQGRSEKAMRWLGFIQGVLWGERLFSLEELKSHNRSDAPAPTFRE